MTEKKHIKTQIHPSAVYSLKLLGGAPCLDFSNTLDWRTGNQPVEMLETFSDLVYWNLRVGLINDEDVKIYLEQAAADPEQAKKALARGIRLREAIFAIFRDNINKKSPKNKDIRLLNSFIAKALSRTHLVYSGEAFSWESKSTAQGLEKILYPVAQSAGDLLVSDQLKKVKICLTPDCGWLFLDTSRNQRRCWCDMQGCGNRAKARRFYKRKKTGQTGWQAGASHSKRLDDGTEKP